MRKLRSFSILVVCLVLFFCKAGSLWAEELSPMTKSLIGMKGLDVFVYKMPDDATRVGLSKIDLEEIVKEKLSALKISIEDDHKPPFIVVSLRSLNPEEGEKAFYHLDVWVWQEAALVRRPDIKIGQTITWRSDILGVASIGRYNKKVLNRLNDIMNNFLSDYQSANPK